MDGDTSGNVTSITAAGKKKKTPAPVSMSDSAWALHNENLLTALNERFVMVCGRDAFAYDRVTGRYLGRGAFLKYARAHITRGETLRFKADKEEKELPAAEFWWDAYTGKQVAQGVITRPFAPGNDAFHEDNKRCEKEAVLNLWPTERESIAEPDPKWKAVPVADLVRKSSLFLTILGLACGDREALEAAQAFSTGYDERREAGEDQPFHILESYAVGFVARLDTATDNLIGARYFMYGFARQVCTPWLPRPHLYYVLQGTGGIGKGLLMQAIRRMVGPGLCANPRPKDLGHRFNAALVGKLFVLVEEIPSFTSRKDRDEWHTDLKDTVSRDTLIVERKGIDTTEVPNIGAWILATNHDDPVPPDRRLVVLKACDVPGADEHARRDWLAENLAGFYLEAGYFLDKDRETGGVSEETPPMLAALLHRMGEVLPSFERWHGEAPKVTQAVRDIAAELEPSYVAEIRYLVEHRRPPFDVDFGESRALLHNLEAAHQLSPDRPRTGKQMEQALRAVCPVPKPKKTRVGNSLKSVWTWRNSDQWDTHGTPENRGAHIAHGKDGKPALTRPFDEPAELEESGDE